MLEDAVGLFLVVRHCAQQNLFCVLRLAFDLTDVVYKVVWQESIPPQIRQLILYYY